MPRPRKIVKVTGRARPLHQQLVEAYSVLRELRGCIERLAGVRVKAVDAGLAEIRKLNDYGKYMYPVLQLYPQGSQWYGECEQVHVTRFRVFAEAFVEATHVSRILSSPASDAKRALAVLKGLEQLLERLYKETRRVEEYGRRLQKPKTIETAIA